MPDSIQPSEDELCASDAAASAWTRRGIELLTENTTASLNEAVGCFDLAIEIRHALPFETNPWMRYGLTAGWLNRGDALTRLGSAQQLEEALKSFDEALRHLGQMPLEHSLLFRKRLAIAWLNRGLCLHAQHTHVSLQQALESFGNCIATAEHESFAGIPEQSQLIAAAWANRGNVLLDLPEPAPIEARHAAIKSLERLKGLEANDYSLAEIGLKARHILCRAIAMLVTRRAAVEPLDEWIDEATEAVEQGMEIARLWEQRGHSEFRELQAELFRFGARVYQTYQPHFLTEFLLEQLERGDTGQLTLNPAMHSAAIEMLWRAAAELPEKRFSQDDPVSFEQLIHDLADLRVTEEKLKQLRERWNR